MQAFPDHNYYQLVELDGNLLKETIHGDHLKKYDQPDVPEPAPEQDIVNVDEGVNA